MISFDFPAVSLDCLESRPKSPFSVVHHLHLSEKWTINKNNNKKEIIFLISNPPSASLWKMNYAHLDNKWLTKKIKPLWKRNSQPDSKDDKVFFSVPIQLAAFPTWADRTSLSREIPRSQSRRSHRHRSRFGFDQPRRQTGSVCIENMWRSRLTDSEWTHLNWSQRFTIPKYLEI